LQRLIKRFRISGETRSIKSVVKTDDRIIIVSVTDVLFVIL